MRRFLRLVLLPSAALALCAQHNAPTADRSPAQLRDEAFVAAQYASLSSAAAAVDRVAARFASGSGAIGLLEQERERLLKELALADRQLALVTSGPESPERAQLVTEAARRRAQARDAVAAVEERISRSHPQYFELTRPKPLTLADVQKLLNPDEAMLVALVLSDATYVWAISRDAATWARSEALSADRLRARVEQLRSSMGVAGSRGSTPQQTRGPVVIGDPGPAPGGSFDVAAAHQLYRDLVLPVETVLAGKQLVMTNVSGPLTSLPLSLLVTEPPQAGSGPTGVQWLGDRYALAELPSVSSLRALRCLLIARVQDAHSGCATVAVSANHAAGGTGRIVLAGFGAPLLGGRLPDGSAPPTAPEDVAADGRAIPAKIRAMANLPQAQAELEGLARQFGTRAEVVIGKDATEAAVKASASLGTARFVVFSTHGLLATEIGDNAEPGLVFTPPPGASAAAANDGLLTASEAAQLRLSADLVVLSACNTAAPSGKPGAEGLSGLARSFLFAGARSLLVSHWAVSDAATSRLMQLTFQNLQESDFRGRAIALQKAMRTLRSEDNGKFADPRFWSPFILVGSS